MQMRRVSRGNPDLRNGPAAPRVSPVSAAMHGSESCHSTSRDSAPGMEGFLPGTGEGGCQNPGGAVHGR